MFSSSVWRLVATRNSHVTPAVLAVRCSCQLRQLEKRLLDTISAVEGTILDDDTVVQALEDLKGEAGDVAKEVCVLGKKGVVVLCWRGRCGRSEEGQHLVID